MSAPRSSAIPPVIDVHLGPGDLNAALRADVAAGLVSTPKELVPKWFYDERGSELFDEITRKNPDGLVLKGFVVIGRVLRQENRLLLGSAGVGVLGFPPVGLFDGQTYSSTVTIPRRLFLHFRHMLLCDLVRRPSFFRVKTIERGVGVIRNEHSREFGIMTVPSPLK